MKKYLIVLLGMFIVNATFAQDKKAKYETVTIQTSAECGDCKARIEDALNYTKGVKYAELDLTTKIVTVKYSTSKLSVQQVKEKIASIGYNADEVLAKEEDVKKLPLCCQPGGMKKH